MKLRFLNATLLSTSFFFTISSLPQKEQALPVSFECNIAADGIPTTYATMERGNVPIIRWASQYFDGSGYTVQHRCELVSNRFQVIYANRSFRYITTSVINGYPVLCATDRVGGDCTGYLFSLPKRGDRNDLVLQIFAIWSETNLVVKQLNNRIYIDFGELLRTRDVES